MGFMQETFSNMKREWGVQNDREKQAKAIEHKTHNRRYVRKKNVRAHHFSGGAKLMPGTTT